MAEAVFDIPHLLLVDDERSIREPLAQYLTKQGFRVTQAGDAEGARARLNAYAIDLAILDIMMPGIDGFQVMKYLSQFGVKVPVLAMSALGPRVEERARELGADGFIAKPFDIRELVVASRRLIEQHAAAIARG